jgi:hypothetical protein
VPTLSHYEQVLSEAGERYHVLPLQGDACALITQRGGRVLGLFPTRDSQNLFWTNSAAFDSVEAFKKFTGEGGWNLGGERIWIAPEIQYNVRDRNDFWGTLSVPPQMDPGDFRFNDYETNVDENEYEVVTIVRDVTLSAYNIGTESQYIFIMSDINPVRNPLDRLQNVSNLMQDVQYFGYIHEVTFNGDDTSTYSESWNLVQLNAGGQLIIPCMPFVEASDYFGDVPEEARQLHYGDVPYLRLNITGKQQYKIGYKSACMTGRMAYHHTLPDGREYLLIRSFFNNPSNVYAEEPPHLPGVNGHSVHVYNDGGEFGGENAFGEMEVTGQTVHGGSEFADGALDYFLMWAYVGTPEAIRRIAHLLLGVKL